jgi:hypothetical protein
MWSRFAVTRLAPLASAWAAIAASKSSSRLPRRSRAALIRPYAWLTASVHSARGISAQIRSKRDCRALFARHYHAPKDDMRQPLNFNAAVRGTRLSLAVIYGLAQKDERPVWKTGEVFGTMAGSRNQHELPVGCRNALSMSRSRLGSTRVSQPRSATSLPSQSAIGQAFLCNR